MTDLIDALLEHASPAWLLAALIVNAALALALLFVNL